MDRRVAASSLFFVLLIVLAHQARAQQVSRLDSLEQEFIYYESLLIINRDQLTLSAYERGVLVKSLVVDVVSTTVSCSECSIYIYQKFPMICEGDTCSLRLSYAKDLRLAIKNKPEGEWLWHWLKPNLTVVKVFTQEELASNIK